MVGAACASPLSMEHNKLEVSAGYTHHLSSRSRLQNKSLQSLTFPNSNSAAATNLNKIKPRSCYLQTFGVSLAVIVNYVLIVCAG